MWESTEFPDLFVLSIPHHGGKDLALGTKRSILDLLEDDMLAWEERIEDGDGEENESENGDSDGIF